MLGNPKTKTDILKKRTAMQSAPASVNPARVVECLPGFSKEDNMIEKFRKKLKKNGQSITWFHRTYLHGKCNYTYLIQQINDPVRLQETTEEAIQKYLDKA